MARVAGRSNWSPLSILNQYTFDRSFLRLGWRSVSSTLKGLIRTQDGTNSSRIVQYSPSQMTLCFGFQRMTNYTILISTLTGVLVDALTMKVNIIMHVVYQILSFG